MHVFKKVKLLVPLFFTAGIVPVWADEPAGQPSASAQVEVNSTQAEICTRSLPILGVAFGNNVDPRLRTISRFGLPVVYVKKDSPAEKAGMKVGDLLLTLDGQKLFFPSQFAALLRTYAPGDLVELRFLRGKETFNSKVPLGVRDGHALNRTAEGESVAPATQERDDIRIIVNGREISLSKNADLKNRVALTADGIIIRTQLDNNVPDELRRVVERFRKVLELPQRIERGFARKLADWPVSTTSSQVFSNNENTIVFTRENNKREVIVRTRKDGEIFRGPCATQEEIDAIPPDVVAIIRGMTHLRPIVSAEKKASPKEKTATADKK